MTRLTIKALQSDIGTAPDGIFGPRSKAALFAKLSNLHAPAITEAQYQALADEWGVPIGHIKGVRKVEAPRGPYDDDGRPSILFERHVMARNTVPAGRFNNSNPSLSGRPYGPGGYGAYSAQYDRLAAACALDPEAAFQACSWGAFQILGENAIAIGYPSAYEMAKALVVSEAAHLESFKRFVEAKKLVDEFRACEPGDAASCVPFVKGYNGTGYARFGYHKKLANAIK